ncbi:hypothetical protein PSA7680_03577 [Pseudoruegeria aquimaris]|uniref:Uncharacterized protein n=1 Tax=Pseudoruegeria aquimaris TaxID=393663 RepID=A0A1Y5TMN8_9RHOB|nr:hypothetical protein PSA7680_03577 [Pseudoruegeria aquimaris]
MGEVSPGGVQGLADGHVHVEVAVGAEAPHEGHPLGGLRLCHVIPQKCLLLDHADRVVGDILRPAGTAELAVADGALMAFPRAEMLVLGDAGVGHLHLAIIHHRTTLVVAFVGEALEIQRAVAQPAQLVVEVAIERARVEDMIEIGRHAWREPGFQVHGDAWMIEDALHHFGVAVLRHALETVEEIVVVVVEAHWQALENGGRQLGGRAAPLLLGVALEESLVERVADETQRLFLEGLGIGDRGIGLRLDEGAGFVRAHGAAEELVDRVQVDRQRIDRSTRRGLHPVLVGHETGVGVHVLPDFLVVGVEDVRAVHMHHDPRFGVAFGVAVPTHVIAPVDDRHLVAGLRQLTPDHRARKPRADKKNGLAHYVTPLWECTR